MPDLLHEQSAHAQDFRAVCGVDEVGRGPLAGPVVAAAVILPDSGAILTHLVAQATDSKKLSAPKREDLNAIILQHCTWAVAECSVAEIDVMNIRVASLTAMVRAVEGLSAAADFALIDGNVTPQEADIACSVPSKAIIKGDLHSVSIACASIIAKVYRDDLMARLHADFPHYGWDSNKGYGAPKHLEGLKTAGITPHHRTSFQPIKGLLAMQKIG